MNSYDATDEFRKFLEGRTSLESFRKADIGIMYVEKGSGSVLQLDFKKGVCSSLDVGADFTVISNPESIWKVRRGQTMSKAAFGNVRNTNAEKLVLEVDLTTGNAILRVG